MNWKKVGQRNYEREFEFVRMNEEGKKIQGFYLGSMLIGKDIKQIIHLLAPMSDDGQLIDNGKILAVNSTAKLQREFKRLEEEGCIGCPVLIVNIGKKKHPNKPVRFWDFEVYYTHEVKLDYDIVKEILEGRKTIPLTENH